MAELSTLARPYAKAAFEYAVEAKDLEGWSESLALAGWLPSNPQSVNKLLSSPSSTAEQQADRFKDLCGDQLSPGLSKFYQHIVRESPAKAFATNFSAI